MSLASVYSRRIKAGVLRFCIPVALSRSGATVNIKPMVLPGVVQIIQTGSTTTTSPTTQQAASGGSSFTASAPASTTSASTTTNAVPTLYLLQSADDNAPAKNDTFVFDGVTWTVQSVAFEYIQGLRVAMVSTATAPPL